MGGAGEEKLNWLTILKTRVSSEQGRWTITSPLGRSWKTFQAHKAARTWHSAPFQPGTPAPILGHGWCLEEKQRRASEGSTNSRSGERSFHSQLQKPKIGENMGPAFYDPNPILSLKANIPRHIFLKSISSHAQDDKPASSFPDITHYTNHVTIQMPGISISTQVL